MAAYGLYTHIQSNKRRSVALLIGLFLMIYVLVFAGALFCSSYCLFRCPSRPLVKDDSTHWLRATGGEE